MPRNKSKTSQGGLTSPTLYDSGLDFPNRGRKKHRRTASANQLQKCHTWLVKYRIYVTPESVAHLSHITIRRESSVAEMFSRIVARMSLLQKCLSSVAKMFYRISCRNVTVARMSHITIRRLSSGKNVTVAEMSHLGPNRTYRPRITPLRWKSSPPRWKSSPPSAEIGDPSMEKLTPPMENDLTPRWKMTRVIRRS